MAEEKRQFPTEVVSLPSKGHYYSKDDPLSSGEIEIKYMTAKEEDILTSQNLIRRGIVIDKLLEALIVDQNINYKDILIGDKNAIMVASRILGYGKEYIVDIDDDSGETESVTIDLTALKDKEIDFSKFERGKNEFSFTLPNSKRDITFKFLTSGDEDEIEKELKSLSKLKNPIDPEMTTRLKRRITSVDGNSDQSNINKFVDNEFLSVDSLAFRDHISSITPDVDMNYSYVSSIDGEVKEITVPVTVQFFWPDTRK